MLPDFYTVIFYLFFQLEMEYPKILCAAIFVVMLSSAALSAPLMSTTELLIRLELAPSLANATTEVRASPWTNTQSDCGGGGTLIVVPFRGKHSRFGDHGKSYPSTFWGIKPEKLKYDRNYSFVLELVPFRDENDSSHSH